MSNTPTHYLALKADDRQELRLPAVLKEHLQQVARTNGESVNEYVLRLVAADVSAEISKAYEWELDAPEFLEVMRLLMLPPTETHDAWAARANTSETSLATKRATALGAPRARTSPRVVQHR